MRHCEVCGTTDYPDLELRGGLCPPCFEETLDEEEKILNQRAEQAMYEAQEEFESLFATADDRIAWEKKHHG